MQPLPTIAVLILAVASRPIEARLWWTGRLSDRTTALLVLGRMPALTLYIALIEGASFPLTLGLTLVASLVPALSYRWMVSLLGEKRAERERAARSSFIG